MNSSRLLLLLALCFKSVSSNGLTGREFSGGCKLHRLSASLGSSVLLPCTLSVSNTTNVSWTQTPEHHLVSLTSDGHVRFSDPRRGRVKAFPNQGSEGNFSIRIDELKDSDLGYYFCMRGQDCFQVDLSKEKGGLSELMRILIYTCVAVALVIMVGVGGYFCTKHTCRCDKTPRDDSFDLADVEGTRAPSTGQGRVHFQQQRGVYINDLVYENDDYDPANQQGENSKSQHTLPTNLQEAAGTSPNHSAGGSHPNSTQFKFVRMERQSTKRKFHTELFNRLRQASFSRHYYVNQGQLNNQEVMEAAHFKKGVKNGRAKENCDYKNPIYNRSTDQLNQM